jgi:hypothetical protein
MKFAAGLARAFAVLVAAGALIGATFALRGSNAAVASLPVVASGVSLLFVVVALVYAALFWAAADALIMLADGDDLHRLTQFQLAQLSARLDGMRDARPAALPSDATERMPPPVR